MPTHDSAWADAEPIVPPKSVEQMTELEKAAEAERRLRADYNFIGTLYSDNDESPARDGEIAELLLDLFKESR